MYTLGSVAAPFLVDLFLVPLPDDVDDQACNVIDYYSAHSAMLTSNQSASNGTMTSHSQRHQVSSVTAMPVLNTSSTTNSAYYNVGLARWAFVPSGGGNAAMVVLLTVTYVMCKRMYKTSDTSGASKDGSSNKSAVSFVLFCAMLATIFFWASVQGSLVMYLQTYAIIGLSWDKSDASYLNVICAVSQVIGRLAGILLSSYVSRRPALSTVVLLITGICGLMLMMMADLWQTVEAMPVAMRIGVFVAGLTYNVETTRQLQ